ncbi:MAG: hypothetical protein Q8916_11545 [Bacteroidota bacterium]|nr:hypothetical protein [Bacteroidota bacterium]MDP4231023.1 hypothetical protein [Bacteroidota bacterium]MDP4235718.1 hypothetical protein [Bacteroidota bacterium]
MKYLFSLVLLVSASSLFAQSSFDEMNGYGGVTWGMTTEQIMAARPNSVRLPKKEHLIGGWNVFVTEPNYKVFGQSQLLKYLMDASTNRLVGVIIEYLGERPSKKELFDSTDSSLTSEFHSPHHHVDYNDEKFEQHIRSWTFAKTKIVLTFAELHGLYDFVTVFYSLPSIE